jgi:hypothetical protein|tara:strand:+ start:3103 stop:3303 length:201 start_codon:yes stop_codon:yes gene_type:complete
MLTLVNRLLGFLSGLTSLFNREKDRKAGRNEVKVAIYEKDKSIRKKSANIDNKPPRNRLHINKRIK